MRLFSKNQNEILFSDMIMDLKIDLVDAFASSKGKGNLAGVTFLTNWPNDQVLIDVAKEVGASETAFIVQKDGQYFIRWFTPTQEVALCGHATISAASVVYENALTKPKSLTF